MELNKPVFQKPNRKRQRTEIDEKESALSNPDVSSLLENVSYVGSNKDQIFFEIKSKVSEIFNDKPDLSYMKNVTATIRLADGRVIYIKADKAIYNKLTNDTSFTKIQLQQNQITKSLVITQTLF